jgi:mono/diheme cytochrome c family protein
MPRALVLALVALLACAACDRAPSAGSLPEWTPADHDTKPGSGQAGGSTQGTRTDAGAAPSLVDITWRQQCATCHGASGRGDGPQGPMFKPPDLAQSKATDAEMASVIRNGRGKMPKFDLPDDVVGGLVARVRSLRAP